MPPRPTVVVVDDEPDIREWLRISLGLDGWHVLEAAGGDAALVILQRLEPDVVMIDNLMPEMSGLELAARLRELPTAAHLLLFSASVDRGDREIAEGLGLHIISKVDRVSLFQTMKALHAESMARRSA